MQPQMNADPRSSVFIRIHLWFIHTLVAAALLGNHSSRLRGKFQTQFRREVAKRAKNREGLLVVAAGRAKELPLTPSEAVE